MPFSCTITGSPTLTVLKYHSAVISHVAALEECKYFSTVTNLITPNPFDHYVHSHPCSSMAPDILDYLRLVERLDGYRNEFLT